MLVAARSMPGGPVSSMMALSTTEGLGASRGANVKRHWAFTSPVQLSNCHV